ncbi:hypothetical protein [Paenibacillus sp. WLX2291]|uniref:hypothetical protein n=1 Tax=Paenibacillus sp. WLX2291 TaxID=3296934 RepID=UPI003983EA8C
MKIFGERSTFSIEYEFKTNPFDEQGLNGKSWGVFRFWVAGKDICMFYKNNRQHQYEWNLIYIVEWMIQNIHIILDEEEFPLPVQGEHTLELLNHSLEFDSANEEEFERWFDIKQDWEFSHSWFSGRGGSYLPVIYFRRVNDQIEVCWDNEDAYNNQVTFLSLKGLEYIPVGIFESVFTGFIEDFLKELQLKSNGIC